MKNFKKVLALVLAVATLLSMATIASAKVTADYTDAEKVNYEEAVDVLGTMGVLDGYKDGSFKPAGTITRAEAAKIIAIFADYDTAAGKFYAAANKFSDVPAGNWAESYIAFAAQTGIIAGVGNGKFNPAGTLTGVQFLKMALCTLGLNAEKEGLIGSNWAVNTLKWAKELGLTAGIDKFDAAAALTREEAAQIMLNVLNTKTYTYGTQIVGNRRISVLGDEVAIQGNKEYYKGWKTAKIAKIERTPVEGDTFARPGHTWTVGKTKLSYVDTPVYTFNNAPMNGCDLAVALGLPVTSTDSIKLDVYADGVKQDDTITLQHNKGAKCTLAATTLGNVGAINEVYELAEDTYRLVVINTYFGKVSNVAAATARRNGHNDAETYELESLVKGYKGIKISGLDNTDGFKKGDYVLYTYSFKDNKIVDVDLATDSFEGKVTRDYSKVFSIDDKTETRAYGYGFTMKEDVERGSYYTFFRDVYGNIIGATDAADTGSIVVVDYAYLEGSRGKNQIVADVVNFEDASIDTITITSYNGGIIDIDALGEMVTKHNDGDYGPKHDKLFKITEKADGTYDASNYTNYSNDADKVQKTATTIGWDNTLGTDSTNYMIAEKKADGTYKYSIVDRAAFNKAKATVYTWHATSATRGGVVDYILASDVTLVDASFMAYIYDMDNAGSKGDKVYYYVTLDGEVSEVYCENFAYNHAGWYNITMTADGAVAASIVETPTADAPAFAWGVQMLAENQIKVNNVTYNQATDFGFVLFDFDTTAIFFDDATEADLAGSWPFYVIFNDANEVETVVIIKGLNVRS